MSAIQTQVREQLDQFKGQVQEASQAVSALEDLMNQVEAGFTKLEGEIAARTAEINKLFDDIEPLIQDINGEFDQDWQAVVAEGEKTVKEFEDDSGLLEQDVHQLSSELDGFVSHLEEHDNTVGHAIDEVRQKADAVIQKAKDTSHGVVEAETNAAQTVVQGVEGAAKTIESDLESVGNTVQQTVSSGLQALLGHGNDLGQLVQQHASQLGDGLKNEDAQLESELQETLAQFESGFTDHITKLTAHIEQLDHAITGVVGKVGDLTSHGVDAVGIMSQAAESTNVGLNEVVGIVQDVKDILDEVGL